MRSIVRGVVALFAAFCIINAVKAAPTIVSPADYSTVSTLSMQFKNILEDGSLGPDGKFATSGGKLIWSNPYFGYSDYYKTVNGVKTENPNSKRVAQRLLSHANSLPIVLKWSNSSGVCTVKLWRTKKDTEAKPQFTVTTTGNSAKFFDLEIGRNYTWTVTDSTGTATGHFFTMNESKSPRILLFDHDPDVSGAETSNTRDIGGYQTYNGGKVVKQGLIYRTAELEWCNAKNEDGHRKELSYLKDTIGIKYDIDFRDHADLTSTDKLGYAGSKSKWTWAWKNGSYLNVNESNIGAGIPRLNINKLTGTQFGAYGTLVPAKSAVTAANKNNRKNVWCAFTNVADSAKWPLVFHCSHGKDRAGTFALLIHGVLGVPKETALKDFAYSWFDSPDEILNPASMAQTITNLFSYTSHSSGNDADFRFQEQCYNFLVKCGTDAGLTADAAKAKVTAFQNAMTEDAEVPDVNPALSTERETDGDTFSYTTVYHRRNGSGGSLGSDNGSTLSYIYSSSTTTSSHAPISSLDNYNTCLCFWPVAGLPYSRPICGYVRVGKFVTYGRYSPSAVGPYNLKLYFTSEGHSVTDRTVIEHRSGIGDYENVDLYFTKYDSNNRGEGGRNLAYVYTGSSAAIEVWANATMRVRDIRDMSQKRTSKGYKAYLKFPKGSCDNARFESHEVEGDGENLLGWFTGGEVGSRQYLKVSKSILQFNAPKKTSGVEGALCLEFSLGTVNTTESAAMLKVAGTLNINAGSTITVDAGGKSAGTYALVSAGTLNDNANLVMNASVENCADGYYGIVVRDGNNLNLVVQEGELDTNPEDIGDADEGAWGYRVRGLGALKNETALVFTNSAKAANWIVPANLENVQFLVVGGGGGGGADNASGAAFGGAGGGGGGVVTGNVSFAEGDIVSVYVGAGGAGGKVATSRTTSITDEDCYGASEKGRESKFSVNNSDYIKAFGGGQDQGVSSALTGTPTDPRGNPHIGGIGGSNAGSRGGYTTLQDDVVLDNIGYIADLTALSNCQRYGNVGGKGTDELFYGYPSAGGGGGASAPGGDAGNASEGWSGGDGGEGLSSDITGTLLVYGSGGGGASGQGSDGGKGGTGAGEGGDRADSQGTSAVANQGGGGGGSSRETEKGGNGGSGIVVLRYVDPDYSDPYVVAVPKAVTGLTYTGSEVTGVESGTGYTITGNKATEAGSYTATATLEDGYTWADGTKEVKEIPWSIAKATNVWTTEPNITPASWIVGRTAGELIMGVAKFGDAAVTMNGAAFTELPTDIGSYSIVFSVEGTANYTSLSKTVSFEITEVPVINPTEYGTADSAASTYTWIGYTGPWMYTTNWTATASGTHGVPNNGTYATADFPATLANAFTCTLNQSVAVNKAEFNSPNMTFVLDNALLTLKGKVDSYAACDFGDGENDNSTIELRGANAGIVSDTKEVRLNFGYRHGEVTPTGTVTVRFVVPETGWESDARLKATGTDSKVVFYANSKLEIDATALGVPAEGTTKTVYLASGTGDDGVYVLSGETNIVCAAGAKGSIKIENKKLVLTVEPDPEGTQPPPVGDWSEIPSLSTNIFNAGTSITVFNGMCENRTVSANYTAADIAALKPGTYTFRATASADGAESLVYEIDFWVLPADFSAANTIVCYGDSITYGAGAVKITVDGRKNYFDGRMEGQTIEGNYPYYLAGMIDSKKYNVINQGTPQQWSDTILAWVGGVDTVSRLPVTLPQGGGDVWAPTNIVFTADNPYGVEGGLHFVRTIQYPPYVNGERNPNNPLNYFAGMAVPMYPAFEAYPEPSGINGSMTGWFGNKRVRIHGVKDANLYFSGDNPNGVYCTDHRWARVSTEGNQTIIPAGTPFVPDTAIIFKDAISVIYTGTNDEMGKSTYNENRDPDIDHTTYIKMIAGTIAKNPSGRHLVVSTLSLNQRSDESEAAFAKEFGEKYLNLHGMMERYGALVADKLGITGITAWDATDGTGFLNSDEIHPNEKGYQVIAYFINQKLIDLNYIEGKRDDDIVFGDGNTDDPGEDTPPVESAVVTNAMPEASWGYTVSGLGDNRNEVAVVFTNENADMTWTVPQNLKNVQFLVVGGGGGGGAVNGDTRTAGAGGGGGGVVTGLVASIEKGVSVTVTVGKGGAAGQMGVAVNGHYAAAVSGTDSAFGCSDKFAVTAYGGGGDDGASSASAAAGYAGQTGGSSAGSRPGCDTETQPKSKEGCVVSEDGLIISSEVFGNAGGAGANVLGPFEQYWAAGGGGGATEAGFAATSWIDWDDFDITPVGKGIHGGNGGAGLISDITGETLVYGSGGGGGSGGANELLGGNGGIGAGSGKTAATTATSTTSINALANQGGGGGGGYNEGGNGGSGIVVFRYTVATEPQLTAVDAPEAVADLVYTGSELTGVEGGEGYTLTDNTATDAGTYEATATLAEGYKWSDDTTEPKTISWSIAKATNEWTTEPSISLESWTQGETAGVLTPGVAKFGEVTSSMAEFPTAVGKYTITYTVVETDNYSGLTKDVSFEILKKAASYDFTVGDVALTDGKLTFTGNFAIDGESEVAKTNLVVSVYDVAEGGDALKTVTVEDIPAGEFNQEIDIAALELADGVYYLAFEVQDEVGNVLDKVEGRSKLTIGETKAVKPTVNYASGTKFTAIGVEQKPVVTPADGNGYTVSYEGDFTAAGTHRIVIALKDGWTWSDGTSDTLTYEYEFIERTYNNWYRATGVGIWESTSKWYKNSNLTTKWNSYPNAYDAKIICQVAGGYAHIDKGAALKIGMAEVSGQFEFKYHTMQLQNNTATPLPLWVTKEGGHSILGPVTFDLEGDGTGYFEIETGATNTFRGVTCDSELFVRYSTADSDDAIIIVSSEDGVYSSSIGWFEGGALEDTCNLVVTNSLLNFIKADAVNGVAGALAIAVHLGENNAAAPSINVAGTLNINDGSTLTVDANSMPCGAYTIINAETFNGADLLTSAAGATVTGLAEFTSGELVREGNKIVLYIETTIPPRVPGFEGGSVATNAVFNEARVAKPIWYKTKPAINGDEIMFNRVTVKVPEYYDVTLETLADGYLVNLKLKDNLKPFIANKVVNGQIVTPAIKIENEKVYIHLENTKSDLYYSLMTSTSLESNEPWSPIYSDPEDNSNFTFGDGVKKLDDSRFFKVGEVSDEPIEKTNE